MTIVSPGQHPLHNSISRHEIRRVAVVDDAFDPLSIASFHEGESQQFLDEVNAEDALVRQFHRSVSEKDSEDLITDADLDPLALKRLWDSRNTPGALQAVVMGTLFRVLGPKVGEVDALCSILKDELHLDPVEKFGTHQDMPEGEFDLAFVDYRFGPSRQEESVKRASLWAKHLYRKGRAFIVLMSSEYEAHVNQEDFRDDSKLTRGLFEFVNKSEIIDSGKFYNRLNSFFAGFEIRHKIHDFASAAEDAIDEAVKALKRSVHALGLEDYAYLEQISLQEDGHPLGDYMLWLFGEYFGHQLAVDDSLQPVRRGVNGLEYERFLPLQRPPSILLAKMYSAAITEPIHEGWGPHPRSLRQDAPIKTVTPSAPATEAAAVDVTGSKATAVNASPSAESMPLYQLGDLLVADKNMPAYLVLNASCDLQFSPGGKRECDIEQSILLLPGRIEQLHDHGDDQNVKRTELFELGEERFRIVWQHTRAFTVPHYKVRSEFDPKGYKRVSRLKLAYALEVQQHFAAQLTRVGVPTPTPVFREQSFDIYGKSAAGDCRFLGRVENGLIVFHHREHDYFVLTVDSVHGILDRLDELAREVAREIDAAQGQPKGDGDSIAKGMERRSKYLVSVREARHALAHRCIFREILHKLPAVGDAINQTDEISKTEKPVRLEIRHTDSLSGKYVSGAPIVLVFSLPDSAASGASAVDENPAATPSEPPIDATGKEKAS